MGDVSGCSVSVLWQLADSAFPAGGLNHSQGLETAMQSGKVSSAGCLRSFAHEVLHSAASSSLAFVTAAHSDPSPENLYALDRASEAALVGNHIAREASIAQGKGFLAASTGAFPEQDFKALRATMSQKEGFKGHLAPLLGLICARLRVSLLDTRRLFLQLALRYAEGSLSAYIYVVM